MNLEENLMFINYYVSREKVTGPRMSLATAVTGQHECHWPTDVTGTHECHWPTNVTGPRMSTCFVCPRQFHMIEKITATLASWETSN